VYSGQGVVWPPFSAEVKNGWRYTPTHLYAFIAGANEQGMPVGISEFVNDLSG
jgi:hypothetical protein